VLWKIKRIIQGKVKMMLKKTFLSVMIALIVFVTGCSHKDEKAPDRAPYKSHNKFHHKTQKAN
jgi:PBP1b-binding outer membrane lipoprotein LpoB